MTTTWLPGRFCCFCTHRLRPGRFVVIANPIGVAVRVHRRCEAEARAAWGAGKPAAVPDASVLLGDGNSRRARIPGG